MGTYVAVLSVFSTTGLADQTGILDAKHCHGIQFGGTGANGQQVYQFTGNYISLDGNPAIAFTGLPAGFQFDTITFTNNETGAFLGTAVGGVSGDANGTTQSVVTWGVYGPRTTNSGASAPTTVFILNPSVPTPFKVIDMLSSYQIALTLTHVSGGGAGEFCYAYDNLKGSGSYEIYLAVTADSSTVSTGKVTTLTAPSSLDLLSTLGIYSAAGLVASPPITSSSPTSLKFTWPSIPSGSYLLVGTEFGGRVYSLGPFVYVLADPSGLYQLVPGKTDDTQYVDHTTMTVEVAIPNPFIKTGFING